MRVFHKKREVRENSEKINIILCNRKIHDLIHWYNIVNPQRSM